MNKTRPTVQAIVKNKDKILIYKGKDTANGKNFYRCLGGGIEFGETSTQALKREMKEELDSEISGIKFLGLCENIFNYRNEQYHEIVFIYECRLKKKELYKKEKIIYKGRRHTTATWEKIDFLKKQNLVPAGIKKLI